MSEEAVSQQSESQGSDSCADAIATIASVSIFVIAILFWISNQ